MIKLSVLISKMPENSFVLNGTKHNFPSKAISRAVNLPCHGHIEQWPVYATGRHNATTTTKIVKNRRVKVITLNDFEASMKPKPQFLAFLESHIRKEKEYRGVGRTGVSMTRLQIFREAFDYLIEAFSSYRPILASIKMEYEQMLDHYAKQITQLEPLKEKLYFFAADCDRKVMEMREGEKADYHKLLKVNEGLRAEMRDRDVELEDLQQQIKKMNETIAELYEKLREEKDARNILVLSKRDDQKPMQSKNEAECNRIQLENEKLKITAFESKKAHSEAMQNVMQLHIDYADVVPRKEFDRITKDFHESMKSLLEVTEEKNKIAIEKQELNELYSAAINHRDNYYMKLMQTKAGHVPDWMICAEFLATSIKKFTHLKRDLSYSQFVDLIQEKIVLGDIQHKSSSSSADRDEKIERQLSEVRKEVGDSVMRGAYLLSEMIASNIMGHGAVQERRKSGFFSKPVSFAK